MNTQTINQSTQPAVLINPFPGLRPFEFDESHLFFGRDGQSERLIAKLAATRFLAVVGTSGSGKSSLVRAGLLPALYSGFMPSAGSAWRIAVMRPGNDPLGNLARALNAPEVFGSDDEANRALQVAITEATLRRGSLGLVEAAREQALPATENLLVVADQFEELFRVEQGAKDTERENDRAAFVKLLLAAKAQREVNIYVVLTMRSDYLGDCAQFWDLPEAINDGQYLIPRLTREQIREAITGPIFVGGTEATPRLINRLLNDVGDNPDQLPILQHALMRTWNHWQEDGSVVPPTDGVSARETSTFVVPPSGGVPEKAQTARLKAELRTRTPIDLEHYEAIGGMGDALSFHADEAFHELPDDRHQVVAERVFKALTEKGPDNREIRRPVTLGALCLIADASEAEVKQVLETFRAPGRSFVMPPDGTELKVESLIDISHESLMRNWVRLKDWVEDEAKSSRIYRRLAETAELFMERKAGLWRNPDLQIALDWQAGAQPNKHWAARYGGGLDNAVAFLSKSETKKALDDAEALRRNQEKAERAQRELAAAQALAEAQRQRAESEMKRAGEQLLAASRLKRLVALLILIGLLALVAAWVAFKNYRSAEANLAQSDSLLYVSRGLLAQAALDQKDYIRANDFLDASFPALGTPAKDDLRSFDWFYRWRQLHDEKATLKGHEDSVFTVAWLPDGRTLASASGDKIVKLWDVVSGQERATLKGHGDGVSSVAFAPDGRTLASGSDDKTVKLWDVASGQEKATLKGHVGTVVSVAFAADGRTLASASGDTVKLWDVASGQEKVTLKGHESSVFSVAFAPDGQTLASGRGGRDDKLMYPILLWRGATDAEV